MDPLKGLDAIDWSSVSHAYGAATDIPEQLGRFVEGDHEVHEEALNELFSSICHQGTVYSATSVAVPFLVNLAAEPSIRSRGPLVYLLALIARGASYVEAHKRLYSKRPVTPEIEAQRVEELANVTKARAAVANEFPRLIPLLLDADDVVRAAVPYVLAAYPERVEESRPALARTFDAERNETARCAILLALGDLGAMSMELWQRTRLGAQSELELFAAALAIASTERSECPAEVIDAIVAVVGDARERDKAWSQIPRQHYGVSSDAMRVFEMLAPPAADLAVERVLAVLPSLDKFRVSPAMRALLKLTFPEADTVGTLSDQQRLVLRALVSADAAWEFKSEELARVGYFKKYGLPGDRDALAALVK